MTAANEMTGSSYPTLSSNTSQQIVDLTEAIARERLGVSGWSDADRDELRVTAAHLMAAVEALHAHPLANDDEPAFVLNLA